MKKGRFLTVIVMSALIAGLLGIGVFVMVSPVFCQEGTGNVVLDQALKEQRDAQANYDGLVSKNASQAEKDLALNNLNKAKEKVKTIRRTQLEGGEQGQAPGTASAGAGEVVEAVHFPPGPPPGRPPEGSEVVEHPPHPPHPAQPFGVPPGLAAHKILLAPAKVVVDYPTNIKG